MSKLAFTLIELIVVIIIIGLVSFLVIKLPSFSSPKINVENLRDYLYPNGTFYLFDDGKEIILINEKWKNEYGKLIDIKNQEDLEKITDKNKINVSFFAPEVYIYDGESFKQKDFGYFFNKKIIFKYSVENGIGDSFILKNGNDFYVFKPFYIKKVASFERAKEEFLLNKFIPKEGSYY
jgi:prepilin-type N-terminal cleavage/methylation domain-containing protein